MGQPSGESCYRWTIILYNLTVNQPPKLCFGLIFVATTAWIKPTLPLSSGPSQQVTCVLNLHSIAQIDLWSLLSIESGLPGIPRPPLEDSLTHIGTTISIVQWI
jgi:hypothetical protein